MDIVLICAFIWSLLGGGASGNASRPGDIVLSRSLHANGVNGGGPLYRTVHVCGLNGGSPL